MLAASPAHCSLRVITGWHVHLSISLSLINYSDNRTDCGCNGAISWMTQSITIKDIWVNNRSSTAFTGGTILKDI